MTTWMDFKIFSWGKEASHKELICMIISVIGSETETSHLRWKNSDHLLPVDGGGYCLESGRREICCGDGNTLYYRGLGSMVSAFVRPDQLVDLRGLYKYCVPGGVHARACVCVHARVCTYPYMAWVSEWVPVAAGGRVWGGPRCYFK